MAKYLDDMKVVSLRVVLVVFVALGSVSCDGEAATEEVVCPYEKSIRIYLHRIRGCAMPPGNENIKKNLEQANTTEQFQQICKTYCDTKPIIHECVVKTVDSADHCLTDRNEFRNFKLLSKMVQTILNSACEHDGSRLVKFFKDMITDESSAKFILEKCFAPTRNIPDHARISTQFGLFLYQKMKRFSKCITDQGTKHEQDYTDFANIFYDVTERMTCEEENADVLCKTIADQECAPHTQGHSDDSLATEFADKAMDCYLAHTDKKNFKHLIESANTVEEYRSLFDDVCSTSDVVEQCLSRVNLLGRLCLTGTNLDTFRGLANVMDILQNLACSDKGIRLSTILGDLRTTLNSTNNVTKGCFEGAVTALNQEEDEVPLPDYRLVQYHVIKTFKNCLADYGRDHSQPLVELANLLGEGNERLECWDYRTRHGVLCNTIEPNLK